METTSQKINNHIVKEIISTDEISFKEMIPLENSDIYTQMEQFGFTLNIESNITRKNNVISKENSIKSMVKAEIEHYKLDPRWRIVEFKTLWDVMNKYDLYIGTTTKYTKELPIENAKELLEYKNSLNKSIDRNSSEYYSAPNYKKTRGQNVGYLGDEPICALMEESMSRYSRRNSGGNHDNYLIIASLQDFDKSSDRHISNRQIFYNSDLKPGLFKVHEKEIPNPDPIIIRPFRLFSDESIVLFDIITSWDREAKDSTIINTQKN